MDYYSNAVNWYESAKFLVSGGFYQQSVAQSCLAVELFLKSQLLIMAPDSELDKSHDTINIFNWRINLCSTPVATPTTN